MIYSPQQPRPLGRPREFDEPIAVKRAMQTFWARGYHGTSIPDLLDATELSRGSLYAAFGDKRSIFLQSLDLYISDALDRTASELDPQQMAMDGLRKCLAGFVDRASGAPGKRGCLAIATAMELAADDSVIRDRIGQLFAKMQAQLAAALARAQVEGQLADGVDPATAARLLFCMVEGMRVVGKIGVDRADSQAIVDAFCDRFLR